jgi:hypothetical protein
MQPLSCAIALMNCDVVNPADKASVARAATTAVNKLHDKALIEGLLVQYEDVSCAEK